MDDLVSVWGYGNAPDAIRPVLGGGKVEVFPTLSLILQVATDTRSLLALRGRGRDTCGPTEATRSMEVAEEEQAHSTTQERQDTKGQQLQGSGQSTSKCEELDQTDRVAISS